MSLALNKPKLDNLTGDIWKSAERLRGKFKAYEYQGVILAKHCTVISSVRPNLQAVAFINNGQKDFICSTGFNVVQPAEHKLSPKFAYYALISEGARQYFEATAKGVGYPAVDDKDFGSLALPLPPLPEQYRIAGYLDATCAAIDAAVTARREDRVYLEGAYRGQVNAEIQGTCQAFNRYNELANPDYTREGGIFDIMAITVIDIWIGFRMRKDFHAVHHQLLVRPRSIGKRLDNPDLTQTEQKVQKARPRLVGRIHAQPVPQQPRQPRSCDAFALGPQLNAQS